MSIREYIVLMFLATTGLAPCSAADAPRTFPYRKAEATTYAQGIIESFARSGQRKDARPSELRMKTPRTSSAIDGHGRRFIYVSFPEKDGPRGFEVIFEVCSARAVSWIDMAPVVYSPVADVVSALRDFESMRGDPKADYPKGCRKD